MEMRGFEVTYLGELVGVDILQAHHIVEGYIWKNVLGGPHHGIHQRGL